MTPTEKMRGDGATTAACIERKPHNRPSSH